MARDVDSFPSISFLIAAKNNSRTIERSIESILREKADVVVVDGRSDDGTSALIDRYQVSHLYDKGTGPANARNIGLEQCLGDYIIILDADQWIPEGFVQSLLDIVQNTNYDVIFCREIWQGSSNWAKPFQELWTEYEALFDGWEYGGPRIYRKDFLQQVGGWDENFFAFEDWDLWNRAKKRNPLSLKSAIFVYSDANQISPSVEFRRGKWYGGSMKQFLKLYPHEWRRLVGIAPPGLVVGYLFSVRIAVRTRKIKVAIRAYVLRFARAFGLLFGVLGI